MSKAEIDAAVSGLPIEQQLAAAVRNDDVDRIKALLDKEPDLIDADVSGGRTAIQEAAAMGRPKALRLLIERGADVTAPDSAGDTPLDLAEQNGASSEVKSLLRGNGKG